MDTYADAPSFFGIQDAHLPPAGQRGHSLMSKECGWIIGDLNSLFLDIHMFIIKAFPFWFARKKRRKNVFIQSNKAHSVKQKWIIHTDVSRRVLLIFPSSLKSCKHMSQKLHNESLYKEQREQFYSRTT